MVSTSTVVSESSLEGRVLQGAYRLDHLIGKGGMAWVYQAYHLQWQQTVAVKVLLPELCQQADFRGRFFREAGIQSQLHHPHVVRVYEFLEDLGILGLSMEWVEGYDLNNWLRQQGGTLSLPDVAWLFPRLVEAVGYAHQQGIVHRDLKPGNIMLHWQHDTWVPKVTDFGVAKLLEEAGLTKTGQQIGTPAYMPPEQWQDSKRVDHRADIYSLGVLLYRLLTGGLPFQGDYGQLLWQVHHVAPEIPVHVPGPVAAIIQRCLAKEAAERFASCAELCDAFLYSMATLGVSPQANPLGHQDSQPTQALPFSVSLAGKDHSDAAFQPTYVPVQGISSASLPHTPAPYAGGLGKEITQQGNSWEQQQATMIDEALRRAAGSSMPATPTQSSILDDTVLAEPARPEQGTMPAKSRRSRALWLILLLAFLIAGGLSLFFFDVW